MSKKEMNENEITVKTLKAKISISELKARSRGQIRGNLGKLFLVATITSILSGGFGASPYAMMVLSILLVSPALLLGANKVYLALVKGEGVRLEKLLDGFDDWWLSFKVQFLTILKSVLWGLLLVVPGVVKYYACAMAPYIIAEDPSVSAGAAVTLSEKMMKGYKRRLFLLDLSFVGWWICSALTFGLVSFYAAPYHSAARTNFYLVIKAAYEVDQQLLEEAKKEAEEAEKAKKEAEEAEKAKKEAEEAAKAEEQSVETEPAPAEEAPQSAE